MRRSTTLAGSVKAMKSLSNFAYTCDSMEVTGIKRKRPTRAAFGSGEGANCEDEYRETGTQCGQQTTGDQDDKLP